MELAISLFSHGRMGRTELGMVLDAIVSPLFPMYFVAGTEEAATPACPYPASKIPGCDVKGTGTDLHPISCLSNKGAGAVYLSELCITALWPEISL